MAPITTPSASRHPALSVGVLDYGLQTLEAFSREHCASHGRLLRRYELSFQALYTEGAAEKMRLIVKPGDAAPELDSAPVHSDNLAISIAHVNAEWQPVEDRLIQPKQASG